MSETSRIRPLGISMIGAELLHHLTRRFAGLIASIGRAGRDRRDYRQMMTMDDRLLQDIGITRGDVLIALQRSQGSCLVARKCRQQGNGRSPLPEHRCVEPCGGPLQQPR